MPMDSKVSDNTSKFEKYGESIRDFLHDSTEQHTVYDYQIKAAQEMYNALRCNANEVNDYPAFKVGMIVGPTGCGKSGIINLLPYFLEAKKACVLTPSKDISRQLEQSFGNDGVQKSFFKQSGIFELPKKLEEVLEQVLLIKEPNDITKRGNLVIVNAQKFGGNSGLSLTHENQTIVENAENFFKKFDLLIVDEAHHYPAKTWKNIVEAFGQKVEGMKPNRVVFITATPYRNIKGVKRCILDEFPNWEHRTYDIKEEVCRGVTIRPCQFYQPNHDYDKQTNRVQILYDDLEELFRKNHALAPGLDKSQQALILVWKKDDARNLADDLNRLEPNYAVPIVSGKERQNLDLFTNGQCRVGITCGVGTEGYDNDNITVCVILRKIRTARVLFQQFVGRCMRLKRVNRAEDKYNGYVLSYREFGQQKLWDERQFISEHDPVENE